MSTSADIMSTSGMFSTSADIMSTLDTMMLVGEQGDENLSIYIENPDVLNIPQCTYNIFHMHHDILLMYGTFPDVLNTYYTGCKFTDAIQKPLIL